MADAHFQVTLSFFWHNILLEQTNEGKYQIRTNANNHHTVVLKMFIKIWKKTTDAYPSNLPKSEINKLVNKCKYNISAARTQTGRYAGKSVYNND